MKSKNKTIAINAVMLYIRMIIVMFVSLYVSRIVLQSLGVVDFGIYSAVGGIVALFNVIRGSLVSATQRYITYALGQSDTYCIKSVFSTSICMHYALCVIIIILAETVGLWFLRNEMNIPEDRYISAFWVYQCSVLSSLIMILSIPYNALIIAHERMNIFAYISLFEVLLQLLVAFILFYFHNSALVVYAILLVLVQLCVRLCYVIYCKKNYEECRRPYILDLKLAKEISSFSGWSFFGNFAYISYTQGVNVLLNLFFGPIVNAANSIAIQVQSAGTRLLSGFQTAIAPQITKSYAEGNVIYLNRLLFTGMRGSYYLVFLLTLPIIMETESILTLWLKNPPQYSVQFVRLVLIQSLIHSISNPMIYAVKATGKIKIYEIIVSSLMLMILPCSYLFLKCGFPPSTVFVVHIVIELISQIFRIFITMSLLKFSIKEFCVSVILRISIVTVLSLVLSYVVKNYMSYIGLEFCLIKASFYLLVCAMCTYFFGVMIEEKKAIVSNLRKWAIKK